MGNHYSQLSMSERNLIHRCRNEEWSFRAIAQKLQRPTCTISREVARNTVGANYDATGAERVTARNGEIEGRFCTAEPGSSVDSTPPVV